MVRVICRMSRWFLVQAVLAELPGQVADYYMKAGLTPKGAF